MFGVNAGNTEIYNVKAMPSPALPYNDIPIPSPGQTFSAISFGNLGCSDISTGENAIKALPALDAELTNLTDSIANIAVARSSYQNEIESFEENDVTSKVSIPRISDVDSPKEAINFTKSKLKSEMSARMMSKTSRMKDLLIPLTTNYFRSHISSSRL